MNKWRDYDDRWEAASLEAHGFPEAAKQVRERLRGREYQRIVGEEPVVLTDRPKRATGWRGAGDPAKRDRFLDKDEADFIAQRRARGISDKQIAAMMGCPITRLSLPVGADLVSEPDPEAERARQRQREQERADRGNTIWRAPAKPRP